MSGGMFALIVVGGTFVLGMASCLVCVSLARRAAPPGSTESRPTATAPPVVVSAQQLYADYHANEIAADEKYKGHDLLVTGRIDSIDKGAFGTMVLRLGVGSSFGLESVMATLNVSQKSKAMLLSKGKRQTVLCTGQGMILGDPALADCNIVDTQPEALGMSYEAALAAMGLPVSASPRKPADTSGQPDLRDDQLSAPMLNASFLADCNTPNGMKVTVKVLVNVGRAIGVSVYTTPPNASVASCIDAAVRQLAWPRNPHLDPFTTTY